MSRAYRYSGFHHRKLRPVFALKIQRRFFPFPFPLFHRDVNMICPAVISASLALARDPQMRTDIASGVAYDHRILSAAAHPEWRHGHAQTNGTPGRSRNAQTRPFQVCDVLHVNISLQDYTGLCACRKCRHFSNFKNTNQLT